MLLQPASFNKYKGKWEFDDKIGYRDAARHEWKAHMRYCSLPSPKLDYANQLLSIATNVLHSHKQGFNIYFTTYLKW